MLFVQFDDVMKMEHHKKRLEEIKTQKPLKTDKVRGRQNTKTVNKKRSKTTLNKIYEMSQQQRRNIADFRQLQHIRLQPSKFNSELQKTNYVRDNFFQTKHKIDAFHMKTKQQKFQHEAYKHKKAMETIKPSSDLSLKQLQKRWVKHSQCKKAKIQSSQRVHRTPEQIRNYVFKMDKAKNQLLSKKKHHNCDPTKNFAMYLENFADHYDNRQKHKHGNH
ncbi:hypothetical protein RFI_29702 [Reticulomyxa filosa]|uniref:Uncharacterized protein n=1 Tax=Reticulomyxa filosa TaxID=46433 RepID=X6M2N4_RETFI|nr:hypothetical protein RFI_29702 [Reticulomyxa filosa]|eukprot:ETO07687.1 hypothetical protein RFI_29702 [Reticulomyxa filosa]